MDVKVNVELEGKKLEHVVAVAVGGSLEELVELAGAEVVYHYAKKGIAGGARAAVGKAAKAGGDIPTTWTPAVIKRGKSEADKVHDMLMKLSPEARAAVLAGLDV